MTFSDGSNLQVINTRMPQPMGTGKVVGPLPPLWDGVR